MRWPLGLFNMTGGEPMSLTERTLVPIGSDESPTSDSHEVDRGWGIWADYWARDLSAQDAVDMEKKKTRTPPNLRHGARRFSVRLLRSSNK